MAYWGRVRRIWHRVKVGGRNPKLAQPIRIGKQLENATTTGAEIAVIDDSARHYKRGDKVQIDLIRDNNPDAGGLGARRPVFGGIVDAVAATSFENEIVLTCTGPLGDLRLTSDDDHDLTGMTDQQAVRFVLKELGIPHKPGKIKGAGYSLGERNDVVWTAGTPGSSIVEELDRITAYATIEGPDGDIQRIKYSRVPGDYSGRSHEYYKGQEGVEFFDNARERGYRDQIVNRWEITGLEYEIGDAEIDGDGDGIAQEGKEGCTRRIWAECSASNPFLGNGVYVTGTLDSDLIQDPGMAKAICKRMLEWHNREADTLRMEVGNDAHIEIGDVIRVRDGAPGIDLSAPKDYLVLSSQQDGHVLTLDLVGGPKGQVGNVRGGIIECCGSIDDEGNCDENEKDDAEEPPPLPDLPDLPDQPSELPCDPAVDETCLPDDPPPGGTDAPPVNPPPTDGATDPDGDPADEDDPVICTPVSPVCPGEGDSGFLTGTLCAPTGNVPQGQITGGMPWADINQWDALIADAAAAHPAADPQFLKSMLIVESGGDENAVGVGGAVGLMQVKPSIWQAEAATFGYDLTTPEGQVGMAAAIIGGDAAATAGMDNQTAFLTVYYPVLNDAGELCRECYGESGHTPQMYLDDIALFSQAIRDACPEPAYDEVEQPMALAIGRCVKDANCPIGWRCADGACEPIPGITPPPRLRGFRRRYGVGDACLIPGWNAAMDNECDFSQVAFRADDQLHVWVTPAGVVERFGVVGRAGFATQGTTTMLSGPGRTDELRLGGAGANVCVSGKVRFGHPDANLSIVLSGDAEPDIAAAHLYASSGLGVGGETVGYMLTNHDNLPVWTGACDPNTYLEDGSCVNNGGYGGNPGATGTDHEFSVCFDTATHDVEIEGSFGSGFSEFDPYEASQGATPTPCSAAYHTLRFDLDGGNPTTNTVGIQVWGIQVLGLATEDGDDPCYGNCCDNPTYEPPGTSAPEDPEQTCVDGCEAVPYEPAMPLPTEHSFVIEGTVTLGDSTTADIDIALDTGDLYTLQIGSGLVGRSAQIVMPDDATTGIGTTPFSVGSTVSYAIGWDAALGEIRAEVEAV